MSKELVISANRHETKVAMLEDDQLVEVFFQRANEYSLAGSIHKGRVTRVLPGMQSAFVDLGLDRDTFLYVSDFFEENEEFDRVAVNREGRPADRDRGGRAPVEAPDEQEAAAESLGERPEQSGAVASEPVAPIAPFQDRSDKGDRDQRGRRSRRRRSRGRGFPDSKYASDVSRSPRPPEAAVTDSSHTPVREPFAPSAASSDLPVLPGESLAKYSRSNIQPLDDGEEEEIQSLQDDQENSGAGVAAAAAPEVELEPVEPESLPPLASAPATEERTEAGTSSVGLGAASAILTEQEPAEATESDLEAEQNDESEQLEETTAPVVSETAGISEGASEPASPESEASASSPAPPLTAQVREQGGRYGHRMPRRMRQKMRGGGSGEARFGQERRGEGAPSASSAESNVARPDQVRTVSRPERSAPASITDLLKEGQEIIVQIAKEPLGQKGARITSHIALPGRYVVYMPTVEHTGVSRKIASDDERLRLKRILQIHHAGLPGGFIVRTAGEGKSEEELAADMTFLSNLWLDIRQKAEKKPAPLLLHHDLDIVQRTLRDQFTDEFKAIWVDNEELYESVVRFVQRFQPALVTRIKLYTRAEPIFDAFNITAELEKALRPKVWLKSGGYIVINQTEALVAIDVNTGKFVGRSNRLEDTIVKTNTEAVKEIVRQVRLSGFGRDHRGGLHRHGRAQESPEGDAGARGRDARRPRALQDSSVQRFWFGRDHPQAGEAEPGARAVHALPALRGRRVR